MNTLGLINICYHRILNMKTDLRLKPSSLVFQGHIKSRYEMTNLEIKKIFMYIIHLRDL